MQQRTGNVEPAPHAAAEFLGRIARPVLKTRELEHRGYPRGESTAREAVQGAEEFEIHAGR